jgi:energy-coupling factor transporter ATP-binding protein EcfA2
MRIARLHIRDIGPFRDEKIDFPRGSDDRLADVYLLTGPNGSGKSTLLYAIASAIGADIGELGRDHSTPRMRTKDSAAAVFGDDGVTWAFGWSARHGQPEPGPASLALGPMELYGGGPVSHYRSATSAHNYAMDAGFFNMSQPADVRPRFAWAAFAYAGQRSLEGGQVGAIEEPKHNPFLDSLSFTETADSGVLAKWITNQQFRLLKAKETGRTQRANEIARSLRDIENTVRRIIGDDTFEFRVTDEDNNVRVRRDGADLAFGVLPDGMKSVVSWIADLLMRLDRIPWVDDIPPMQRSFLLLLDEIDIHLHPAWQRQILPAVQRLFPNAQIIASTHSPFVVASADDAQVIELGVENGVASVRRTYQSQVGRSYSAVLGEIFGVESEFDIETEELFQRFREAKLRLLRGDQGAQGEIDEVLEALAQRGEEVRDIAGYEKRQLDRQLARSAP